MAELMAEPLISGPLMAEPWEHVKEEPHAKKYPEKEIVDIVEKFLHSSFEEGLKLLIGDARLCFEVLYPEVYRLFSLLKALWRHSPNHSEQVVTVLDKVCALCSKRWTYDRNVRVSFTVRDFVTAFSNLIPVMVYIRKLEHARILSLPPTSESDSEKVLHPSYLQSARTVVKYSFVKEYRPRLTEQGRVYTNINGVGTPTLTVAEYQAFFAKITNNGEWPVLIGHLGEMVVIPFDQIDAVWTDGVLLSIHFQGEKLDYDFTSSTRLSANADRYLHWTDPNDVIAVNQGYREWIQGK